MASKTSNLSRKTKAEVIAEYEKLQQELEDAKNIAEEVHTSENQAVMAKGEDLTKGARNKISQSISNVQKSVEGSLTTIVNALSKEVDELKELQDAVELMRKNLKTHHNIKVAADSLENLVNENEIKKHEFDKEAKQREIELDKKLDEKERTWKRDQEEKEYNAKRKLAREEEKFKEEMNREKEKLQERTEKLKQQEKEVAESLKSEYDAKMKQAEQEWQSEKQVLELKMSNLEETVKAQKSEINTLKQEAEKANKRAQELAVKVIQGAKIES